MARTRKQVAEINVVPMIDVMLVLLVIFMVTAPFINPAQVELPSVGKTSQTPAQPLEVIIKESGEYVLKNRATGGTERGVTKRELAAEFAALHRAAPDQPVVIAADKNVRYEEVMHAMNQLQKAQITRIGLLARPAP
ncbi:MAG: biopolymer transport protein ExbD/TolR [Proteobacteria bacterium]|jgi:biopolymer transport protein TolR|nr:biopolymer transport protein ExbD/TolR [Pseudomonadota bacterium]